MICLTIAIGFLQTQPFSPKVRIVLYLFILIFIYLVNYVSFILFSTEKILPKEKIQETTTKRYRKGEYRMQNYLFPVPIDDENYEIYGRTLTYNPIGGDFYNFLTDAQENYWIGIGDSVGHGYQ
ncbi:serine/threonine-protein phosphatase, partial [Leptospira interrogans serovar Pomona]|nr:serine/threonine-protein phosphatase [Leptospira interrogans serovar Pomona]